jgi:hypothetical protein
MATPNLPMGDGVVGGCQSGESGVALFAWVGDSGEVIADVGPQAIECQPARDEEEFRVGVAVGPEDLDVEVAGSVG